jgi:hypothetical protein
MPIASLRSREWPIRALKKYSVRNSSVVRALMDEIKPRAIRLALKENSMLRSAFVSSVLVTIVAASVVLAVPGCSADGGPTPPSVADRDAGDVIDADGSPGQPPGKEGGSGDASGEAATDANVPPSFASDSLNCGAAGHSCLGAACSGGLCGPEFVPTGGYRVDDYTFDDDGSVIVVTDVKNAGIYGKEVRRVAAGGASATLLFTRDDNILTNIVFTQGALFGEGSGITRYDGSGGSTATKTVLAPNGRLLALDRPEMYFTDNGDLVRLNASTSAMTKLPSIPGSGGKFSVCPAGPYIYANNTNQFLRIPKDGMSAHAVVPVTGISATDIAFDLFVTPTTLGGLFVSNGGSCATTTYSLWTAPISGGAVNTRATFTGLVSAPVASGEYIYWGENGCNTRTTPTRIMRRRADGSDAPLLLFSGSALSGVKVSGDHVYWTEGSSLQRVAK